MAYVHWDAISTRQLSISNTVPAGGSGLTMTTAGTSPAISLTNSGTGNAITVNQDGAVGSTGSTDGAIFIENTGNTGIGFGVYTNIGATMGAPLVRFESANSAGDNEILRIVQGSDTTGVVIDSDADAINPALDIQRDGSHASEIVGLAINVNNAGAGEPVGIDFASMAQGEAAFRFIADATDPTGGGAAATGRVAIDIGGSVVYMAYY